MNNIQYLDLAASFSNQAEVTLGGQYRWGKFAPFNRNWPTKRPETCGLGLEIDRKVHAILFYLNQSEEQFLKKTFNVDY